MLSETQAQRASILKKQGCGVTWRRQPGQKKWVARRNTSATCWGNWLIFILSANTLAGCESILTWMSGFLYKQAQERKNMLSWAQDAHAKMAPDARLQRLSLYHYHPL